MRGGEGMGREMSRAAREAARALVALGGTMPDLEMPARRQSGLSATEAGLAKVAEDCAVYGAEPKGEMP